MRELYSRLVFNILCGNTDDHARNHAAFWDGQRLKLTPAYDICPQSRTGNEASQAMLIAGHWDEVCAEAKVTRTDRKLLGSRQFLNAYSLEGSGVETVRLT